MIEKDFENEDIFAFQKAITPIVAKYSRHSLPRKIAFMCMFTGILELTLDLLTKEWIFQHIAIAMNTDDLVKELKEKESKHASSITDTEDSGEQEMDSTKIADDWPGRNRQV